MKTDKLLGWAVKSKRNRGTPWLWTPVFRTKKLANDEILDTFSFKSNLSRDYELRRIKRECNLEVVRVETVEVIP